MKRTAIYNKLNKLNVIEVGSGMGRSIFQTKESILINPVFDKKDFIISLELQLTYQNKIFNEITYIIDKQRYEKMYVN